MSLKLPIFTRIYGDIFKTVPLAYLVTQWTGAGHSETATDNVGNNYFFNLSRYILPSYVCAKETKKCCLTLPGTSNFAILDSTRGGPRGNTPPHLLLRIEPSLDLKKRI